MEQCLKKVYCQSCEGDRNYTIKEIIKHMTYKNNDFKYIHKQAICKTCKEVMFVPILNELNFSKVLLMASKYEANKPK